MNIDWQILHFIRDNLHSELGDSFFAHFTALGDGGFLWIAIALVFLCIKGYRRTGLLMLLAMLATTIVGNEILKDLVQRPRPCWLEEVSNMLIAMPDDYSFPSGHSSSSAAAATFMVRTKNRALGVLGVILAGLMMFSRMYCYVHFPSDVLAGCALGIVMALLVDVIVRKIKGATINNLNHQV